MYVWTGIILLASDQSLRFIDLILRRRSRVQVGVNMASELQVIFEVKTSLAGFGRGKNL